MPKTFGIAPLIPGLVNEVALEIFLHLIVIDPDCPFTLILVCTAWRDIVLSHKTLQRRQRNSAFVENREKAEEGICIVSFDGGGPGSMSQLRMLDEFMLRLAFKPDVEVEELRPADYFDLMGGVGFGGFVALLLGRLHMTTSHAMEELAAIGAETFPKGNDVVTPDVTMARLRKAIESMLERHGHSVDIKLRDSSDNRCKVVLFAATTAVMDHCQAFRTYRSPRRCLDCTFIDAACAAMATPDYFSSVAIGPRLRKQDFVGTPHGFDNPIREVIKEAHLVFGEQKPVSFVLSLGSGQKARLSDLDHHITRLSHIHSDGVARDLQHQLRGFGEYLRLNVDRGMENIELDDWHKLGSIETYTTVYLEMSQITKYIDKASQWLLQRNGSLTLGQLSGTSAGSVVKFHSETLKDYLAMEFKQMHNVVQQLGIEKIMLVDAIGNHIPIPTEFCLTYPMLLDVIDVYFRHQKAPGSDFVERGDYRLVHGDRRSIVGPMEWNRIRKVGLLVEMSMILRTRNEDKPRCPRCRTWFEDRVMDGWAQCQSCSGQFQTETQVQPAYMTPFGDDPMIEPSIVTPAVRGSNSRRPLTRKRTIGGEPETLRFRLFSVNASPNELNPPIVEYSATPPVPTTDIIPADGRSQASEPEPAEEGARPITPIPMVLPPSLMPSLWMSPSSSSNHEEADILGERGVLEETPEVPSKAREMSREVERATQSAAPVPVTPYVVIRGRLVTPPSSSSDEETSEESEEDNQDEDSDVGVISDSDSLTPAPSPPIVAKPFVFSTTVALPTQGTVKAAIESRSSKPDDRVEEDPIPNFVENQAPTTDAATSPASVALEPGRGSASVAVSNEFRPSVSTPIDTPQVPADWEEPTVPAIPVRRMRLKDYARRRKKETGVSPTNGISQAGFPRFSAGWSPLLAGHSVSLPAHSSSVVILSSEEPAPGSQAWATNQHVGVKAETSPVARPYTEDAGVRVAVDIPPALIRVVPMSLPADSFRFPSHLHSPARDSKPNGNEPNSLRTLSLAPEAPSLGVTPAPSFSSNQNDLATNPNGSLERSLEHARDHFNFRPIQAFAKPYTNQNTKNDQERRVQKPTRACTVCHVIVSTQNFGRHLRSKAHLIALESQHT